MWVFGGYVVGNALVGGYPVATHWWALGQADGNGVATEPGATAYAVLAVCDAVHGVANLIFGQYKRATGGAVLLQLWLGVVSFDISLCVTLTLYVAFGSAYAGVGGTQVCDDFDVIAIIRGERIVYIGGAQLFHLSA